MDERNHYVYIHINLINNKKYVGQAKGDPKRRWRPHGEGYIGRCPKFS